MFKKLLRFLNPRKVLYRFNLTGGNYSATNPLIKGVATSPQPISTYINQQQRRIVARSRQLLLKNDYGRGALRLVQQNVIGEKGLRFQANTRKADNTLDAELNKMVEKAWREWSMPMFCSASGKSSLSGLLKDAINSLVADGEFFVELHEDDTSKYKLKLSVRDAQRCSPVETSRPRAKDVTALQNGIIFDRTTGKPITYLFSDEWSNDQYYDDHSTPNRYDKIEADRIIHGFLPEQTLQRRGLPLLHASIDRLTMLDDYEESALRAAQVGAKKLGFFTHNKDSVPDADFDLKDHPIKTETGSFSELPPGLDLTTFDTQYPHDQYDPFTMRMLHAIAVGFGVAYASLSGDVADANFSSLRHAMLAERGNWKMMQEWLIETLMTPVYHRWLMYQLNAGMFSMRGRRMGLSDLEKCKMVSWTPQRWEWIDPKNEQAGISQAIKDLVLSPSEAIRAKGKDPVEVFAQIGEDMKLMEASGIPIEVILDTFSNQIQQVEVDDNADTNKGKERSKQSGRK